MDHISDVYALVGDLAETALRLGQAADQLAVATSRRAERGDLRHDSGQDIAAAVAAACEQLTAAGGTAAHAAAQLRAAQQSLGPIADRGDREPR